MAGGAEAGDRSQQVVGLDAATHLARGGCRFEQSLERGAELFLEVGGQGVIGGVSRMQSRGEPAFRGDEVDVTMEPAGQRLGGLVLGGQGRGGLGAGVDLAAEDADDQVRTLREVAVDRPDADAGRSAIARTGASTPEATNTSFAASSSASMLRRASARTRRSGRPGAESPSPGASFSPLTTTLLTSGSMFRIILERGSA